ncbi:DUF302 domain-containing protein [Nocardia pseudobrasiliensis]|uniref:Uncharacterized protein (DUF302 family) n=1 Tax=Nocardia pseudobrasiliensis TaxID=45979 RepID=A0A370IC11_9NOCA|nr:DUF302 domain-containing protein [Nocardia pseudobrasiliensis]RDI68268.1 uncharacterized protein (DUF302 family) [Nocardia pseudobrasiliensis]
MNYRVDVCEAVPQAILRVPRQIRTDRLGEDLSSGMRALGAAVRRAGLTASGSPAICYRDEPATDDAILVDFEIPVEPGTMLGPASGAEVTIAPAALVARTCHRGGYGGLPSAYLALEQWMRESGYRPIGRATEVYLVGPDEVTDPGRLITEVRIPVTPPLALAVELTDPFDEVVRSTREALSDQGFGILTEMDVQAILREKLGEDIDRYLILGVCNPGLAARALRADPRAGLLLPCNVVIRATRPTTMVETADPRVLPQVIQQPDLAEIAEQAHRLLLAALDRLRSAGSDAR